jgi:putative transposase
VLSAGSLHWRTGALLETAGPRRDGALFVRHLGELRDRLRRYRVIHVICDNDKFHTHGAVVGPAGRRPWRDVPPPGNTGGGG